MIADALCITGKDKSGIIYISSVLPLFPNLLRTSHDFRTEAEQFGDAVSKSLVTIWLNTLQAVMPSN